MQAERPNWFAQIYDLSYTVEVCWHGHMDPCKYDSMKNIRLIRQFRHTQSINYLI